MCIRNDIVSDRWVADIRSRRWNEMNITHTYIITHIYYLGEYIKKI